MLGGYPPQQILKYTPDGPKIMISRLETPFVSLYYYYYYYYYDVVSFIPIITKGCICDLTCNFWYT